jgi:chitinase
MNLYAWLLLANLHLVHSTKMAAVESQTECGLNAATPNATCPLNRCCSGFGYCGTTSSFCGQGCQSNCEQPKPRAAQSDSQKCIIGYWEAFNLNQSCVSYPHVCRNVFVKGGRETDQCQGAMPVSSIPANLLTHLNVAFAYIGADYQMASMSGVATNIYSRQVAIRLSIQSLVRKFLHGLCVLGQKNNMQYD